MGWLLQMLSRIWVINLFMAVLVIFIGVKSYGVWTEGGQTALKMQAVKKSKARPKKRVVQKRMPPELAYAVVVDKTLFTPDRKEFIPEEEPEQEPEAKQLYISGKKIVLYGVIVMDDYKSALITNPRPKTGERKTKWVKVEDPIGDFMVTLINKNSILLTKGSKEYKILLHDKDKPKRRATATKKETKPKVISTAPKKSPPRSKASKKKELPDGKYETIDTPFGKIKRRIK